jgi:cell division septum initiation protein DivIVA
LADLVAQGWTPPFTTYRVLQGEEVEQLIARLRISVPSAIREGERTVAEREQILAAARAEAERIVAEARQQAMALVSERSLVQTAQQEADRIVDEGKELARRRSAEADAYAVQVLQELSQHLQSVMRQVDNGIQVMQDGAPAAGQPPAKPAARPRAKPKQTGNVADGF